MALNSAFIDEIKARIVADNAAVLMLCRSGVRSKAAAIAMTAEGYSPCYNVAGGFEGDADANKHRGLTGGWKAAGLPWVQS
jgi:rhodanese-related sulfurtransferase